MLLPGSRLLISDGGGDTGIADRVKAFTVALCVSVAQRWESVAILTETVDPQFHDGSEAQSMSVEDE